MAGRRGSTLKSLGLACGVAVVAATVAVQGQTARAKPTAGGWAVERTPDGRPDFQGVWANNTVTPLERPAQWEGKTTLTDAEVADLQRIANQIYENDGDAQFGDGLIIAVLDKQTNPKSTDKQTGNYNQFWLVGRDWHDRRTSLITSPPDGKLPPLTPEAKQRREAELAHRKAHAYEDPETINLGERCVNFTVPRLNAGYNSYFQIVQSLEYVTIMAEMAHDARIIPIGRREHLPRGITKWNGDSIGRWEGDTLVVDTTNFSPKSDFLGSHENLHLVERFTRVSKDVLNWEITIDDPTTWTRPWTVMIPLRHKDELIYEYACHEANEAMEGMLRGHRFQEKQGTAKPTSGGN
ncbi:MAG: hypothetical protein FJW27_05790 [Acidimicrobiia bacterium]|nr:hypothetical protein [Acidimicrobiia bacterium]